MTTISLKDFLLTGNFGPVPFRTTKAEIISLLGKPGEDRDFGSGISYLFYNGFEFLYWTEDGELYAIQNDSIGNLFEDSELYPLNETTQVDLSFLCFGKSLSFGNIKTHLTQHGISELLFAPDWFTSSLGHLYLYSFRNGKWEIIASAQHRRDDEPLLPNLIKSKRKYYLRGADFYNDDKPYQTQIKFKK